jgi:selenocysteine lyase/cysteine desulfurase
VRPAPDSLPDRWETGTQVQELIAGIDAAVDYLAELGKHCDPTVTDRRGALLAAYRATHDHEMGLFLRLAEGLFAIPDLQFFGISDLKRLHERCSTVSIRLANHSPAEVAAFLGERGIFTWDGNYYALNLTERLGVEANGGLLRIGLVHYNTTEEVQSLLACLRELATSS